MSALVTMSCERCGKVIVDEPRLDPIWCDPCSAERNVGFTANRFGNTMEETVRNTSIKDTDGLWRMVRKHQLQPHHTHYWSDETSSWHEVER